MSQTKVGKIRLRCLSELQTKSDNETITILSDDKTPEKPKKAGKTRAATTTRKAKNEELKCNAQIILSNTTIKRTLKKEPLPGQLRIDAFFKSGTKSYKVEAQPKTKTTKTQQKKRRGCKRLFVEQSETTSVSDADYKPSTARKRVQLNVSDVIDLCSEEETDCQPAAAAVVSPMVSIPSANLPDESCSSKENVPKGRKRKRCPPYKIIEGTSFVVDGFQFGDIPNATHYFLSHYHADHYVGLTRKFAHPLYMSAITARLVRTFIPIEEQYLHEIELNKSIQLNDVDITAIEANHCPGAIMLLFKLKTGKCILHTGDFRANFDMESFPIFWNTPHIDLLYLDTTYLSKNYDFCHQTDSIERLCLLVKQFQEKHLDKRILYVCGSYLIGKEKVWQSLAEQFSLRIWTEPHRRKAIDCLNWPELQLRLCDNPLEANLHVISMGKISYPQLDTYFKTFEPHFDMLLGIRPSGWEKNSKPSFGKRISVIGVEYSEHSSYKELERFVRFLKPKQVISTVPVGRDLCVTAKVPVKWYQYQGYGGMLSNGYQPTISSFLETPRRQLPAVANETLDMLISPLPADNIVQLDEEVAKEPVDGIQRFLSDASDDLLSFV